MLAATARRAGRVPGLDGLRVLAVAAVLAYHAYPGWLPGGFLGVDVFFVVSGYLVTRQLLGEHAVHGTIRLRAFYLRRARRLLPALGVLLVAVALGGLLVWRAQAGVLRTDLAASLGYATNWWFIARPPGPASPVQHLWPLAVEEQFYLLWPALLMLLLRYPRKTSGVATVGLVAGVLAVASTGLMAVLAIAGEVPYRTDPARLVFGTDTHAMGLLLGAALAALSVRHGRLLARVPPWLADVTAGLALLALLYCLANVDGYQTGLYRCGYLGVSALAGLLVLACGHPGALAGPVFELRPVRWLGRRSYEIYLWHWPVFLLIGGVQFVDYQSGWDQGGWEQGGGAVALARLPLRLLITLVLAGLTHRYVTLPVRRGWPGKVARRGQARTSAVEAAEAAALHRPAADRPAADRPTADRPTAAASRSGLRSDAGGG